MQTITDTVLSIYELCQITNDTITFNFIKDGCILSNISHSTVANIFIDRSLFNKKEQYSLIVLPTEKDLIKKEVLRSTYITENCTIVYSNLNRRHPKYEYYSVIVIMTNNVTELKKICKAYKLKAFL